MLGSGLHAGRAAGTYQFIGHCGAQLELSQDCALAQTAYARARRKQPPVVVRAWPLPTLKSFRESLQSTQALLTYTLPQIAYQPGVSPKAGVHAQKPALRALNGPIHADVMAAYHHKRLIPVRWH
jgi:hypothetical protein